jgi:GDP-L-fucose synthase
MNKILITGSTGLVGNYLKKIITDATYVSSKNYNLLEHKNVKQMFKDIRPNIVIHLAARVGGIHHNILEPVKYFEENILMNTLTISEAYKNKVETFIGILSSCIYPNQINEYPINEKKLFEGAPHQDLFSYAYAKRCMAIQIEAYNSRYNTSYNYLIPCNLYGEFDKFDEIEGHFVGALVQKIYNAKKNNNKFITLFGDGSPFRQFMHARDLAEIIKLTIINKTKKSFNVATEENYTVKKIAEIALDACDAKDLQINFDTSKPNGQNRKDIDIKMMKSLFPDFKPIKLYEGIKQVYKSITDSQ